VAHLGYKLAERTLLALGAREEGQRTYAAAKNTRLVGDWIEANSSGNQEIRMSLRTMRARARQLARDDDYFKGFCDTAVTNVVGQKGIKLEPNAVDAEGKKIKAVNDSLKKAWAKFGRKAYVSACGTQTWRDISELALRTVMVDGECVMQIIPDKTNPFKMALHFIDADWLDEDYNEPRLPNGNRVIMSVEIDKYNRPVAYYFTPPRWNSIFLAEQVEAPATRRKERKRIEARNIIHIFHRMRPGDVRGMTWAHTAMIRLNMLNGYEEAELVGQRVAASISAYAVPPAPEAGFTGNDSPDDIEQEVQAGMIQSLPAGYDLKVFDPKRPGNAYAAFVKQILRACARGLGLSYTTFASDAEATSYSSIRDGSIQERDKWRGLQEFLAEHLCQAVFEQWLKWNIDSAELDVPASMFEEVLYPQWRGRGFDWVDPSKDTKADIEAVNAGLKTRTEILAERGRDFDEVMAEFAHENEVMEELGLSFGADKEALNDLDKIAAQGELDQQAAATKQKQAAA
jgi:lambda family phage portal protein